MVRGQRPGFDPDDEFPTISRFGWQSFASSAVGGTFFRSAVWPRLGPTQQALARSQQGPMVGIPFHCSPTSPASRLDRSVFTSFNFAASGAHSPSRPPSAGVANHLIPMATTEQRVRHQGCSDVGGFRWRVVLRICKEAGARVSTNIRVQDFDLLPGGQLDDRRLEVVADGLPLFHGAQLAIDTTLVSPVRANKVPWRQCATQNGAALDQARRTKERRYPELTGEYGRARLVVLACETGGRWSEEAHDFLRHLARARARSEPQEIRAATLLVQTLVHSIVMLCCAGVPVTVGAPWRFGCHQLRTWSGATGSPRVR